MTGAATWAEPDPFTGYLEECRQLVVDEIRELVPRDRRPGSQLYELMLDYPLRAGKALRPALCIATCRALGGHLESVLRTAAVLELYHNAFLIHDDVEDGSEKRRSEKTLHRLHGVPIAVNVGDGMLALTMQPLLDNIELIGLGRALRILEVVARMARESAEGQMMELDWIRRADWTPSERDYVRMVYKKTCWYTFITPVLVGAIASGADEETASRLARFTIPMGIAFQIQDDILNLAGEEERTGKESSGDLWEGKHTLLLIHALREASSADRGRALAVLEKGRPGDGVRGPVKTAAEVGFLRELVDRSQAIEHAALASRRRSSRAAASFATLAPLLAPGAHRDFLSSLLEFVIRRDW